MHTEEQLQALRERALKVFGEVPPDNILPFVFDCTAGEVTEEDIAWANGVIAGIFMKNMTENLSSDGHCLPGTLSEDKWKWD
jgi:hypothetical protein